MTPLEQLEELKKETTRIFSLFPGGKHVAESVQTIIDKSFDLGKREQARIDEDAVMDVDTDEIECNCLAHCGCIVHRFINALTAVAPSEGKE